MQSWGATLFRNLESFPGQLATTPPILSAREEGLRSRKDIVRAARNVERFSEHVRGGIDRKADMVVRSEEHTSELQSLMRISYAVFCLTKKTAQVMNALTDRSRLHQNTTT